MSAKHTDGPWKALDMGHGYRVEPAGIWLGKSSAHAYGETRANANLVAAAPGMLLTLSWLVGLHDERPSDAAEQMPLALAAARAAIRNATGEPS